MPAIALYRSRWRRPRRHRSPFRHRPSNRRSARYAWALLLARIYEAFPLRGTHYGADMRIIAFITDGPSLRGILAHLGEPTASPRIAPARKCHDKRVEQPVTAEGQRSTRASDATTPRSARLERLSSRLRASRRPSTGEAAGLVDESYDKRALIQVFNRARG